MTDQLPDLPANEYPAFRPRPRRRGVGRWIVAALGVLALVGVLVAAPWDSGRRQAYADQWVVWTEPPSAEVEQLADELALTDDGRRVFFATRPQIEPAREFEAHCPVEAEVVLGCYYRGRIFVYDVTDERLEGTVQSTSAHELLHAVYERMDVADATRIDALVADYVATLPADDATLAIVETYPAAQRADEWHSRLGTSYATLPAALEQHYSRVFANRQLVVAFDTESRSQIDDYTNRIEQLSTELDAASSDLAARSAAYDADIATLNADISSFNQRADSGAFESQSDFDRERSAIIARQEALETQRVALNADVDAYNAKVAELTSLDSERAELYQHLDSHSAP
jgi:hypothetical protein